MYISHIYTPKASTSLVFSSHVFFTQKFCLSRVQTSCSFFLRSSLVAHHFHQWRPQTPYSLDHSIENLLCLRDVHIRPSSREENEENSNFDQRMIGSGVNNNGDKTFFYEMLIRSLDIVYKRHC